MKTPLEALLSYAESIAKKELNNPTTYPELDAEHK